MGLGRVGFWFGFGGQGIEVTVSDALQALVKTEIIFPCRGEMAASSWEAGLSNQPWARPGRTLK